MAKHKDGTTGRYPYTREHCERVIAEAVQRWGPNAARGSFGYRQPIPMSPVCFSFVESPRTPGAYRQIPYAS